MNEETIKIMRMSRQQSPIQIVTDQKLPDNVEYLK